RSRARPAGTGRQDQEIRRPVLRDRDLELLQMKTFDTKVEPHFTLHEAAERFFPGGHVTVRSLRTEIKKGRLSVTEVAGKFLVTESAIAEMLERCRRCRVKENPETLSQATQTTAAEYLDHQGRSG